MCSFFNFVRCMNVCVTEQECRKWRKLSEILWWKVQDKCAMFNLYFTSQNMWFFSIHVNTMYYFLSGEHFCQISFQFLFFFHSKYNLNLFPQYLAKSNISNHGFWWPCSLLKLEVYKKKFALYRHLSKEAFSKRTQDLWQYLLCIHCNINYSQQRKL